MLILALILKPFQLCESTAYCAIPPFQKRVCQRIHPELLKVGIQDFTSAQTFPNCS
jgi:hypothetical protein